MVFCLKVRHAQVCLVLVSWMVGFIRGRSIMKSFGVFVLYMIKYDSSLPFDNICRVGPQPHDSSSNSSLSHN